MVGGVAGKKYRVIVYVLPPRMSQSDYIRYKKTGIQLKDLARQGPQLSNEKYRAFVSYTIANTVPNTKIVYRQLIPPGRQRVYGVDKVVTSCPQFILCRGTQARSNRVRVISGRIAPRPQRKYVKDPINYKYHYKLKCKCKDIKCVCKAICKTCYTKPIVAPTCKSFTF